jgi:hypothetical protein
MPLNLRDTRESATGGAIKQNGQIGIPAISNRVNDDTQQIQTSTTCSPKSEECINKPFSYHMSPGIELWTDQLKESFATTDEPARLRRILIGAQSYLDAGLTQSFRK